MISAATDGRPQQQSPIRVKIKVILTLAIIPIIYLAYVISGPTESSVSVLRLPADASAGQALRQVLPQSWGFFTRPAESPMVVPYEVTNVMELTPLSVGVNAEPQFWFGLDRTSRAQAVEISLLLKGIPQQEWAACTGDVRACAEDWRTEVADRVVVNEYEKRTVCGRVAMVAEAVTPFAWRSLEPDERIPQEILILDVKCGTQP